MGGGELDFPGAPCEYPVVDKAVDLGPFMVSGGSRFFTEGFVVISPGGLFKLLCCSDDREHIGQEFLNSGWVLLVHGGHEDSKTLNPGDNISDWLTTCPSYFEAGSDNVLLGVGIRVQRSI